MRARDTPLDDGLRVLMDRELFHLRRACAIAQLLPELCFGFCTHLIQCWREALPNLVHLRVLRIAFRTNEAALFLPADLE